MNKVKVSVPGKLYIAGEYSVVTPGQSAIIASVDRFLTVSVEPSHINQFISEGFTEKPLTWSFSDNYFSWSDESPRFKLVRVVIEWFERLRKEMDKKAQTYAIHIHSELNHIDGQKFGLGSSGALTVGLIKALAQFYQLKIDNLKIYKLAVLAQLSIGISSSFGDLAASTFTGLIYYTSPQRQFLKSKLKDKQSVKGLISAHWPDLCIEPIPLPEKWQWVVGWTGNPASSHHMVRQIDTQTPHYKNFLEESNHCVLQMKQALRQKNWGIFVRSIQQNRRLLNELGNESQLMIETTTLHYFCDLANDYGGSAKSSGAGGGDCGIAWFVKDKQAKSFEDKLVRSNSITPLQLNIFKE